MTPWNPTKYTRPVSGYRGLSAYWGAGWCWAWKGHWNTRTVSLRHVEIGGRPEGRSRFSEPRRVPSCVLVRHVSRCSVAGLRLRPRDGCSRPAGRTPGGHLERPRRDGFGRQVVGEPVATEFRARMVTEMAVGPPGCGPRGDCRRTCASNTSTALRRQAPVDFHASRSLTVPPVRSSAPV